MTMGLWTTQRGNMIQAQKLTRSLLEEKGRSR